MKRNHSKQTTRERVFRPLVPIMALAVTLGACKMGNNSDVNREDVKEEMKEAADTTKAYLEGQRQMIVASYEERVELIEQQIRSLRQQAEVASANAQSQISQSVDRLEGNLQSLQADMNEWKESSANAWEEMKKGVDEAVSKLEDSVEAAKDEFGG